jgi:hypothetical protein
MGREYPYKNSHLGVSLAIFGNIQLSLLERQMRVGASKNPF